MLGAGQWGHLARPVDHDSRMATEVAFRDEMRALRCGAEPVYVCRRRTVQSHSLTCPEKCHPLFGERRAGSRADAVHTRHHLREPSLSDALRDRVRAAAMSVSRVREVHDLVLIDTGPDGIEAVVHLKLPGELVLDDAHEIAEQVERAIRESATEIVAVQTHLEPLAEEASGRREDRAGETERAVAEAVGGPYRDLRVLSTAEGPVVLLTVGVPPETSLVDAHAEASRLSRRIREALPTVADVVVHTEP